MPVPFARHTTFAQLRDHLIYLGCVYGPLQVDYTRDAMVRFENPVPGREIPPDAVMKLMPDDAQILPSKIRSVCEQLEIDPAEFGFGYP